jgi:hypothetical protein
VGLVGLRRWPLRRTEGIGRKTWWESWVLAIWVGSNVWHWFVGNLVFWFSRSKEMIGLCWLKLVEMDGASVHGRWAFEAEKKD